MAWRHWGQMLRGGTESVQLEALRLRDFIFEVFFLGTAMSNVLSHSRGRRAGRPNTLAGILRPQHVEGRPPVVDAEGLTATRIGVAIRPTGRAQTGAVVPAQRGER